MTVVDPMTGACLSSLRVTADMSGKNAIGISSASAFPSSFMVATNNANNRLAIAYGSNKAKKGDTYAMLLSIRSASSPPIIHWKCRLPEADLTGGLSVSPCGHYVVGGGASGTCFVWSSLGGGDLLRTFKAHYRSVTCLAWSDCGRYLVTGGADGMVHLYSLMELVDKSGRSSKRAITPLHTWSLHHFPVTCLTPMDSGRMASSAEDGHIVIMELFSKLTVSTIKVPDGVTCLTYHDSRLFAGTNGGRIFSMDLDAYAMHQTEKQGAMISQIERKKQEEFLTAQEQVFGKPNEDESASTRLFQSEWIGHERSVSSIAFLVEGYEERLISGDQQGQLRIWDVESRTCLKVLQPWSNTHASMATSAAEKTSKSSEGGSHPISSIMIVAQPQDASSSVASSGMFAVPAASHQKSQLGIATLIPPLQRYTQEQQQTNSAANAAGASASCATTVPFLKCNRKTESLDFWQARTIPRKRKRSSRASDIISYESVEGAGKGQGEAKLLEEARAKIAQLEKDLATKGVEVARWEKVNNKLVAKLKTSN